ncbi:MAG: hypothetical protein WAL50_16250 [Kineosporiaceae bacterium]
MRSTLDKLISWTGLVLAAVLLVAGGLLSWASGFIADNVSQQLGDQHITMPAGAALDNPQIKPYLEQYAGQPLENGAQAKAYADHYILVHMNAAGGGKTYSEVSGEFMKLSADPAADKAEVAKLGELRQTLFMGNTLRGLLLNAYAFATMGTIAGLAAIGAYVAAALLLGLALLGLWHARRIAAAPHDASTATAVPAGV